MLKKMGVEEGFKNFENIRGQSNRTIIGRDRTVTHLWDWLYQCIFPKMKKVLVFNKAKKKSKLRCKFRGTFLHNTKESDVLWSV